MSENLYDAVKKVWKEHESEYGNKLSEWIENLEEAEKKICGMKQAPRKDRGFHQWGALQIFTPYTGAKKKNPKLSLRYCGVDVASLVIGEKLEVIIDKRQAEKNEKFKNTALIKRRFNWVSEEARAFRSFFDNKEMKNDDTGDYENRLQAFMFRNMTNESTGIYNNCQPVLLGGLPFQFPIPIGANKGLPKDAIGIRTGGHLDILARRGHGKGVHPAIWELKRPGNYHSSSFKQVYIYGVTLALMVRQKSKWYQVMGFKSTTSPEKIIIDIILVIDKNSEDKLKKDLSSFPISSLDLIEEKTKLIPYVSYYTWDKNEPQFEPLQSLKEYMDQNR